MRLSELDSCPLTDELIDRLLFDGLQYSGQKADLIMVLGSKKACDYRVPLAAEIFSESGAEKMLFCGGRVQDTSMGTMPEYRSMLMAADNLGLDRNVILTEENSMATWDNFSNSAGIIAENLPDCKEIILVTTAYHMRRALLHAQKQLPHYKFIPAPADKGSCRRSNWRLTEKGIRTAHDECKKLAEYAKNGYIDDQEI
ncbi:MAG: YdcF family protein [Ruminococcus sp.]|nr:YdcF family protein [Ruminococcus sp.]